MAESAASFFSSTDGAFFFTLFKLTPFGAEAWIAGLVYMVSIHVCTVSEENLF